MANEQKRTPAYVPYKTFKNTLAGMDHVPDTVDNSAFQSMNGSTRNFFFGALRFFELIDNNGVASDELRQLAGASDAEWKSGMATLIKKYYTDQIPALEKGTISTLKKSFGDDIGASVISPACRFLIAAAKETGITVSPTIENSTVGTSSPRRKRVTRSTPRNDGGRDTLPPRPPTGTISFPIHIPGLEPGSIVVPKKIQSQHLPMFMAMVSAVEAYAKAQSDVTAESGVDDNDE